MTIILCENTYANYSSDCVRSQQIFFSELKFKNFPPFSHNQYDVTTPNSRDSSWSKELIFINNNIRKEITEKCASPLLNIYEMYFFIHNILFT